MIIFCKIPYARFIYSSENGFIKMRYNLIPPKCTYGDLIVNLCKLGFFYPDVGRANTTATNLAHDMLMDVRHEYVELNRTSHQLNKTLVDLTASVL